MGNESQLCARIDARHITHVYVLQQPEDMPLDYTVVVPVPAGGPAGLAGRPVQPRVRARPIVEHRLSSAKSTGSSIVSSGLSLCLGGQAASGSNTRASRRSTILIPVDCKPTDEIEQFSVVIFINIPDMVSQQSPSTRTFMVRVGRQVGRQGLDGLFWATELCCVGG